VRVLFSVRPFYSHFASVAPIALALKDAGEEVLIASGASLRSTVDATGLAFVTAGFDASYGPDAAHLPRGVDWDFHRSGIGIKVKDLLQVAKSWAPDVVVRDQSDFAGVIVSEHLAIPYATVGLGLLTPKSWWRRVLGNELDAVRMAYSVPPDPSSARLDPFLYLDRTPPSFQWDQRALVPPITSIRPISLDNAWPGPSTRRLDALTGRPTVYVTLGTVYNCHAATMRELLAGLAALPVNVVCTVGPNQDPEAFAGLGGDAWVEAYIPQSAILPYCQAIVCHGGFSSIMGAFAHGVPAIIVPLGSDHGANAVRCETLGVGLTITRSDVNRSLAVSVERIISESRFRKAVAGLQDEICRLPGSSHAAKLVACLAE